MMIKPILIGEGLSKILTGEFFYIFVNFCK
jgi:hypothetical protein